VTTQSELSASCIIVGVKIDLKGVTEQTVLEM